MTNFAKLVRDYAVLDAQISELTDARSALKEELLKIAEFAPNKNGVLEARIKGQFADVVITQSFPVTFSQDLVKILISEEDFERCRVKAIKPTIKARVDFKAAALA